MCKLSLDNCMVSSSCEISHELLKIISMFFSDSWHNQSAYSKRKMDWDKWKENNTKWARIVYALLCKTVTSLLA
jgi:hypothetical protein